MKVTGVDVYGFVMAALAFLFAVVTVVAIQPAFLSMFADFGSELPALTRLMLKKGPALAFGVVPFLIVVSGVAMNADRTGRVMRAGSATLVTTLFIVTTVVAMYLPIWSIAGQIK
ncbi:MAG: hypothetical protein ACO1OB_23815 [Archangium sp.]